MSSIKTAIGLMSGTSMDGIDAALISTDGQHILDIKAHASFPYNDDFRSLLKTALKEADLIVDRYDRPNDLKSIECEITNKHIEAVTSFIKTLNLTAKHIDIIGFHGQTILHRPQQALTVQLGDGKCLAKQSNIKVVYDMRANDMKNGGQGAPLVPIYHKALMQKLAQHFPDEIAFPICFINIGGISNLTYLDLQDNLIAFDCGPGNVLIDQWVNYKTGLNYDDGGKMGLKGKLDQNIIETYKNHPFFIQKSAGSLDWRDFAPLKQDIPLNDGTATLAYITAYGILNSLRHVPNLPKTFIVSGGGAQNGAIMKYLTDLAKPLPAKVMSSDHFGMKNDFIEAEAWGYLAVRSLYGLPLTYPSTTGCKLPVSGGVITS